MKNKYGNKGIKEKAKEKEKSLQRAELNIKNKTTLGGLSGESQKSASHLKMVEVGEKAETLRTAEARGEVRISAEVMKRLLENSLPKGDVLTAAQLAGIQAAKKTSELIPLCHPLRLTSAKVEIIPKPEENLVEVKSVVKAVDRTGVEMEALTAVVVACLTIYDMCKAFDKRIVISDVHLLSKNGGKSGDFHWERE